jgi:hypothetical protein
VGALPTRLALLLLVGLGCERQRDSRGDSSSGGVEQQPAPLTDTRAAGASTRVSPEISHVVIAPDISEETPVVERRLQPAPGRPTFLRNDTLYAAAQELVTVLKPGAQVSLSDRVVVVDGRRLTVTGLEQNDAIYVPVKAFARQFGAFTRINEVDGSATIWPHKSLIYWKANGPGNAPVLLEAAAEGLLPPSAKSKQH